ncbi:hypothetical protein BDQ12DRAFT_693005 [Crucibulum laeve]|uniref:Uncharacterized protein n=1 Tax=Crucibulum laeve TaxID=68775 RepID=A0A5C3LIQ9_9AGAR|nr:hypothetical protein BDQ12DRAFT_693005 [Crucibulum laeve]
MHRYTMLHLIFPFSYLMAGQVQHHRLISPTILPGAFDSTLPSLPIYPAHACLFLLIFIPSISQLEERGTVIGYFANHPDVTGSIPV